MMNHSDTETQSGQVVAGKDGTWRDRSSSILSSCLLWTSVSLWLIPSSPAAAADWLLAKAYKLPSEYTNQESGYFSIIEGHNGKLYIGAAKYGVDAYLLE